MLGLTVLTDSKLEKVDAMEMLCFIESRCRCGMPKEGTEGNNDATAGGSSLQVIS